MTFDLRLHSSQATGIQFLRIDKDLLDWLKREAEEQNSKYQTLLNNVLRQARGSNPDRLSELENRLTKLEKKIS